jgi:demethylmenaquinone methyltransferase/2-methoxy-6-polyprenyl-1,4-benzoquinol methylase
MTGDFRRAEALDDLRGTFGREVIGDAARQREVTALFDRIAPRYDLMNDLMSFGTHRLWKRVMVRQTMAALRGQEGPLVDLAGGTGDIALAVRRADPARRIIVADASAGMLEVARARGGAGLEYLHAPAEALPLADGSAAGVTLAFGLRNMTDPAGALREVARVLRPGGSLILLEFSRPQAWFAPFYGLHARFVIPALGAMIARDKRAYTYLVESIRRFPEAGAIARELDRAGLRVTSARPFVFGVAMLHVAVRA